ncbi:hypothetical protein ACWEWD_33015 [Streptomyces tendae]
MSDDDSPDNVLRMPRIGSPPPPPVPPAPTLAEPPDAPDMAPDGVRISVFDAPAVPHAPHTPDSVPAALRGDGLDPAAAAAPVPPPRTSVLSLAAVLAIALAAFEGLQTWVQESGPRRAEAAKHQREMELLAAKAGADATRLGAEAGREHARGRRVPSSHDYGRSALGRGSGGPGRGSGGIGPGRSGTGRTSPSSGLSQGRSAGGRGTGGGRAPGGRSHLGSTGSGGTGPGRNGGPSGRNGATGNRNGAASDRNSSPRSRNGGTGGSGIRASGASGAPGSGSSGRRSARQRVADWWSKGKKSPSGPGNAASSKGSGAGGSTRASRGGTAPKATGGPVKGGPTFWDDLKNRVGGGGRSKSTRSTDSTPRNHGPGKPPTVGATPGPGKGDRDRVHFKDAAWEAVNDRWKKRRDTWTEGGGPRRRGKTSSQDGEKDDSRRGRKAANGGRRTHQGRATEDREAGPHGYDQPRSSPFDQAPDSAVTITVEQVDPPGAHAKRWEPTAIGPGQQALPTQGAPALPRAPQRPAGPRPGTTRRKDPIPMPASSRPAGTVPAPVTASVPAPGGLAAQHATDITLDDVLKALNVLTTEGMETYDDCADLARKARQLLEELETMAADLAADHNVVGHRTMAALAVLMESVAQLAVQSERMARAALTAAELAEAEETALARDYRPTQAATIDAGLTAPSARLHNEN